MIIWVLKALRIPVVLVLILLALGVYIWLRKKGKGKGTLKSMAQKMVDTFKSWRDKLATDLQVEVGFRADTAKLLATIIVLLGAVVII